jgi:molybdopterin molybdotransferase
MPASSELFNVLPPADALAKWFAAWQPRHQVETVPHTAAIGRVLAGDVTSPEALPAFARSVVDGYALRAADTFGASPGLPALMRVIGEAPMGRAVDVPMAAGEAVLVHTGSMIPRDADAVVMVEHTQQVQGAEFREQNTDNRVLTSEADSRHSALSTQHSALGTENTEIEILRAVAPGDNVLQVGEDVAMGQVVLRAGHTLRPHDIGGLAALGIAHVELVRRPRVGILSTGDEVVPATATPQPGQVRDVNSAALAALVAQSGGEPVGYGIVPDARSQLEAAMRTARAECDIVVVSAGSSVSNRDMSVEVIDGLGRPGVLVHGVAIKPGKPTILAVADGAPVIGLPGNPVSAMIVAQVFLVPAIARMLGRSQQHRNFVRARLARNLASTTGREDYVQVRLEERDGEIWAVPVLAKSNLIFSMVAADGLFTIMLDANGLQAGEYVDVQLYNNC